MTAMTLTSESKQLALELHALLNDIEPARWRDEQEAALRARLQTLQARLEQLLGRYADEADEKKLAAQARFAEIRQLIEEYRPDAGATTRKLDELREAWMALRDRVEPAYEELAVALKADDLVVPSLRPTNYTRNIFHVGAALTAVLIVELVPMFSGDWGFWPVVAAAWFFAAWGWSMELGRKVSARVNDLLMRAFSLVSHPHEAHHVNSATWYVTALAALSITFEPMVCAPALAVLGLADPAAAIIGKRWGRIRFENGRSLEGTLAFILVGTLAAAATLFAFHGGEPAAKLWAVSVAAALVGGLTELWISRVDDNLGIPVAAGAAAWLVLAIW